MYSFGYIFLNKAVIKRHVSKSDFNKYSITEPNYCLYTPYYDVGRQIFIYKIVADKKMSKYDLN